MRILHLTALCFIIATIAIVISPIVAFAQEGGTTVGFTELVDGLLPYVTEVVFGLLALLVSWASLKFTQYTGIKIEANHREALQSALENGVNYGINKAAEKGRTITVDVRNEVLREGVYYVQKSVPDALKFFNITPEGLKTYLEAKLDSK